MDRKGFIRTLEAVIAIIIVFVFIYVLMQDRVDNVDSSESIKSLEENVLRGISENEDYRNCIVGLTQPYWDFSSNTRDLSEQDIKCVSDINGYMQSSLGRFKDNYVLVACDVNKCGVPSSLPDKKVYTTAVIITSSLKNVDYNPKIVRLWVW